MTGRRFGKPFILSPPTLDRVRGSRSSRLPTEPCVRVRTRAPHVSRIHCMGVPIQTKDNGKEP